MLKQTLMSLRFSFVQAVEAGPAQTQPESAKAESEQTQPTDTPKVASGPAEPEDEEHRKKFTKKY
jgi:hypothetical protein